MSEYRCPDCKKMVIKWSFNAFGNADISFGGFDFDDIKWRYICRNCGHEVPEGKISELIEDERSKS